MLYLYVATRPDNPLYSANLTIKLHNLTTTGPVLLTQPAIADDDVIPTSTYMSYSPYQLGPGCNCYERMGFSGWLPAAPPVVTITRLDTVAHIVSGTFAGQLRSRDTTTYSIEEGRFDVKYQ
ncbi:hypothetical protein [Hymenobacter piscis]|uniref:hypothetical protein n=1 Tax=Hymenobacter piscis TaxID=2839984 RepID=UPI001FE599CB|nr:hypothetical protein [Hymenobacter piscis]